MLPEFDDIVLGAYVDSELDPVLAARIESAARRSPELQRRIEAIRRVNAAVRALCDPRSTPDDGPPQSH